MTLVGGREGKASVLLASGRGGKASVLPVGGKGGKGGGPGTVGWM